jgi:hypothetical protein
MARFETITKLDAAERQLRQAVRRFFDEDDMIGVHTLTMAASGILNDLAKRRGIKRPFRDNSFLRPGKEKWWHGVLTDAQNFFKHADRDPDATLDFYPGATPFLMFDAVLLHHELRRDSGANPWIAETLVFMQWFGLKYPDSVGGILHEASVTMASRGMSPDDFDLFRLVLDATRRNERLTGSAIPQPPR